MRHSLCHSYLGPFYPFRINKTTSPFDHCWKEGGFRQLDHQILRAMYVQKLLYYIQTLDSVLACSTKSSAQAGIRSFNVAKHDMTNA